MTDFEDYIKEKRKIEDKYKQDLIELENKYKIYTSRQINSLEEKVIELKRKRIKEKEIIKLLNLTKYEVHKLCAGYKKKLYEDIIENCKNSLSITELAKKYNYSRGHIALITKDVRTIKTKNKQKENREKIKELAKKGLSKKEIILTTNFKKSYVFHVLKGQGVKYE
jgi:hypothetical protein